MSKDEIIDAINSDVKKNDTLPLMDIFKIRSICDLTLEIDRDSNKYFYCININDIIDKAFDVKILTDNKWELSSDGKKIILFI